MSRFLAWLLPTNFMAHGHSYLWRPDVLWLHVSSDGLIATSYFAIALALVYLLRRRRAVLPYWWVPALFAAFMFFGGATHAMSMWTVWRPDYLVDGLVKGLTALVSAASAITVFAVLPRVRALRTPIELRAEVDAQTAELAAANARLRREVAARERGEVALRQSEARFRATFENAATGIAHIAPDGRFLHVNAELCRLTGYSREELFARSFADITHPHDLEKDALQVRRLLAGETDSYVTEKRYVRKDGSIVWVMVTASLTRNPDGRPLHFISVVDDITERKRAQEALSESAQRLSALANSLPTLAFAADVRGLLTFTNVRFQAYTGLTAETLLGEGWLRALHPEDRARAQATWSRSVVTGEAYAAEYRLRRHDGVHRWHLCRCEPVRDWTGAVVDWFGTATDIEEHKQGEVVLHEKELRMRLALEASGAATWVIDYASEDVEHFDARSCELAGFTPGQRSWPAGTFCRLLHPEDRARMQAAFSQTHENTGPGPMIEYRILRSDGQIRWLQGAGIMQRDGSGRARRFIGVSIDVTGRKRLEAELRSTIQKLAEADRRKDEFLATLAHELRNPLAPIRSGIQLMKLSAGGADDTLRRTTEMMERQMSHLVRLVDDLLDVSRVTRGKVQLRRERLALKDVLRGALESSWTPMESKRLNLTVSLTDEPLIVEGDRDRLTQVFSNILANAAKYTAAGGNAWLSLHHEGGEAVVRVKDTGIGIPPDALEQIFEMFSQLKPSEHGEGGLGIGLALVKQLVQMHGGHVEARSDGTGRGSEFIVRLPALDAATLGTRPIAAPQRPAIPGPRRRVLVVDDNRDAAESLAALLTLLQHETRQVHDGAAAIAAAEEFAPDVVFMDIGMPFMSGLEAARAIRHLPLSRQPRIIALTGWSQDADRERSREAGIDQHLVKPIELEALRRVLELPELANS